MALGFGKLHINAVKKLEKTGSFKKLSHVLSCLSLYRQERPAKMSKLSEGIPIPTLKYFAYSGTFSYKLSPFGRTLEPSIPHSLSVTIGTAKNGHFRFSALEFSEAKLEINDCLVDPYLTPAPGAAVIVLLQRGAKGNILHHIFRKRLDHTFLL